MSTEKASQRLYKREKLCSTQAIDNLFARGDSASGLYSSLAFPLRAVWRVADDERAAPVTQFLISVPKRRLRQAVDRVRMRRLVREAWRLNKDAIPQIAGLQIGFVYVAPSTLSYAKVQKALLRLMDSVNKSLNPPVDTEDTTLSK